MKYAIYFTLFHSEETLKINKSKIHPINQHLNFIPNNSYIMNYRSNITFLEDLPKKK